MTTSRRKKLSAATTAAAFTLVAFGLVPSDAMSQSTAMQEDALTKAQFLEDIGSAERIDKAGRLRMLSQRIPAAACNVYAEINSGESEAILHDAILEFDQILAALEFGDESLGIEAFQDVDRIREALSGQLSGGVSPGSLMMAYVDWAFHLAQAPGKQMELGVKAGRKWQRLMAHLMASGRPHPVGERFRLDRFETGRGLLDEEGTGSQHNLH